MQVTKDMLPPGRWVLQVRELQGDHIQDVLQDGWSSEDINDAHFERIAIDVTDICGAFDLKLEQTDFDYLVLTED